MATLPQLRNCFRCSTITAVGLLQDIDYIIQKQDGTESTIIKKICDSCVQEINAQIEAANAQT